MDISFAHTIRAARQNADLTQADVAARVGITQGQLSRIERGERFGSLELMNALVDTLDLDARARSIGSLEVIAAYHSISIEELMADVQRAGEELNASSTAASVTSTFGVTVTRTCSPDCTGCEAHA